MKEYRIRAKSAEHRKAIIGALEGLGYIQAASNSNFHYPEWPVVGLSERKRHIVFWSCDSSAGVTHESLDALLAAILRDRQTVVLTVDDYKVEVTAGNVKIDQYGGFIPLVFLNLDDFDQIAAAVAKVRGQ